MWLQLGLTPTMILPPGVAMSEDFVGTLPPK